MKIYNQNELLRLRFSIKVFYIGVPDEKGSCNNISLKIPEISFYVPDLDFIDNYEREKGVELDTHFKSLVLDRLHGYVEEVLGEYKEDYSFEECVKGDVVIYKTKEPSIYEEFTTNDIVITISILNRPRNYEYESLDEVQSKISERLQLLINKIREEELPLLDDLRLDAI